MDYRYQTPAYGSAARSPQGRAGSPSRWQTPAARGTDGVDSGVVPRLLAEEAVNDLIRYSLVPAVLVPAIVPALEAALMQMVPSVLGRAVANSLAGGSVGSPLKRGASAAAASQPSPPL